MRSDDAFEVELASWVEEGPFVAPAAPVRAALDFARAHPHPERAHGGGWRLVMSGIGIHATHPSRAPQWMIAGAAAAAIIAVALIGLGSLGDHAARDSTGVAAPAVSITGTESCAVTEDGTPLNDVETRGRVVHCTMTASDARVSGDAVRTVTHQEFAGEPGPFGADRIEFGSLALRAAAGTWNGWFVASGDADALEADFVLIGAGPYAGLTYRGSSDQTASGWTLSGTVEPVDADRLAGWVDIAPTKIPTPTSVDGVERYEGLEATWTIDATDDRIAGTAFQVADHEVRPDSTERSAGTITLTNDGGSWTGSFEWDTATSPYLRTGVLVGDGDYAGLQLRYDLRTHDGYRFLLDAAIDPTD